MTKRISHTVPQRLKKWNLIFRRQIFIQHSMGLEEGYELGIFEKNKFKRHWYIYFQKFNCFVMGSRLEDNNFEIFKSPIFFIRTFSMVNFSKPEEFEFEYIINNIYAYVCVYVLRKMLMPLATTKISATYQYDDIYTSTWVSSMLHLSICILFW